MILSGHQDLLAVLLLRAQYELACPLVHKLSREISLDGQACLLYVCCGLQNMIQVPSDEGLKSIDTQTNSSKDSSNGYIHTNVMSHVSYLSHVSDMSHVSSIRVLDIYTHKYKQLDDDTAHECSVFLRRICTRHPARSRDLMLVQHTRCCAHHHHIYIKTYVL